DDAHEAGAVPEPPRRVGRGPAVLRHQPLERVHRVRARRGDGRRVRDQAGENVAPGRGPVAGGRVGERVAPAAAEYSRTRSTKSLSSAIRVPAKIGESLAYTQRPSGSRRSTEPSGSNAMAATKPSASR